MIIDHDEEMAIFIPVTIIFRVSVYYKGVADRTRVDKDEHKEGDVRLLYIFLHHFIFKNV